MKDVHLSDEQFAAALAAPPRAADAAHLAACPACREELERIGGALAGMSQWTQATAERTPGFWYAQRRAVVEQLAAQAHPARLAAWAGALATLVLAAALLTQMPAQEAVQQATRSAQPVTLDPDHALLLEIEDSLRRPVPRPFEPVLLVTQELSRAAESAESQP
jgi:predicted anti-sigma-YlaC factor YlaD